jgi:hypothetical protein
MRSSSWWPTHPGQSAPDPQVQRPRYRYWAFISYASNDEGWARSLHRQLEAYRIPRDVRPDPSMELPSTQRLRPVFRDDDELAASGNLGDQLRDALDRSRYLIVLASPAAAASNWVNAEVEHFIEANRTKDILVLMVSGEPGGEPELEALPGALKQLAAEPHWVDGRAHTRLDRKTFLRLAAGMLNVGFDVLWQRDRRRRRRRLATWMAAILLLGGMVGGALLRQQRIAAQDRPQRQIAAFRQFLSADILKNSREFDPKFKAADVDFDIVRTDDLNADNLIDFFVFNRTVTYCGSGGCGMGVYVSEGGGRYREVLDLFGSSTPLTRSAKSGGYKEVLATHYMIEAEPAYSVFRWTGREYELAHYEFCNGILIEYCEPVIIAPVDQAASERLTVAPGAEYLRRPERSSTPVERVTSTPGRVIGKVSNGEWYLVEIWKGESGFVSRQYVHQS